MRQGEPYLIEKITYDENGKEIKEYEGFCVDLAKKIAEFCNFTYTIRPVKDNKYGSQEDNGTWNGMVGELVRHVSRKTAVCKQLHRFEFSCLRRACEQTIATFLQFLKPRENSLEMRVFPKLNTNVLHVHVDLGC